MNCTNKQQETAECEKRGCEGCFYNEEVDEMIGELGYTETGAEIYKTADEMFEELGYKKESKYYYHTEKEIRGTLKHIRFLRQTREFVVESNLRFSEEITMQELQAINKKVQELRMERINIMEDEIKVGEYVRTKDGILFKTTEYWVEEYEKEPEIYTNIKKHSSNLIDLIEVRRLCKWRTSSW